MQVGAVPPYWFNPSGFKFDPLAVLCLFLSLGFSPNPSCAGFDLLPLLRFGVLVELNKEKPAGGGEGGTMCLGASKQKYLPGSWGIFGGTCRRLPFGLKETRYRAAKRLSEVAI